MALTYCPACRTIRSCPACTAANQRTISERARVFRDSDEYRLAVEPHCLEFRAMLRRLAVEHDRPLPDHLVVTPPPAPRRNSPA